MINFFKNKKIIEVLKSLEQYKYIILIFVILGFAFYWFEIRPMQIKKSCYKEANKYASDLMKAKNEWRIKYNEQVNTDDENFYSYQEDLDEWYNNCLKKKGF
ncbi:MAG: hypothetical protein WC164_00870 [Patescibacteria group bacterium]